jgi:hypothetical protein
MDAMYAHDMSSCSANLKCTDPREATSYNSDCKIQTQVLYVSRAANSEKRCTVDDVLMDTFANKRMFRSPEMLTIFLERAGLSEGRNQVKIRGHIPFAELLDLDKYATKCNLSNKYILMGVMVHDGRGIGKFNL